MEFAIYTKSLLFIFSTFTLHFGLVFLSLFWIMFLIACRREPFLALSPASPKTLHSSVFPLKPSPLALLFLLFRTNCPPFKRAYLFVYLAQCFCVMLLPDGVLASIPPTFLAWRWGCPHLLDKPCELFGGWIVAVAGHNSLCNGSELAEEIITCEKQCLGNRIWDLIYAKRSLCSALISGACLKNLSFPALTPS